MFLIISLILLITLFYYWYVSRIEKLRLFSRNGIPTPPPNFLLGNMVEYARNGTIDFHKKLLENHGPIVGYYLGVVPYLVISDKTLLHEILVSSTTSKQFLTRPRRIPGGVNPDPKRKNMLAHLPPETWQNVRKALSGMFNPIRLKPQIPKLKVSIEERFMELIEKRKSDADEVELGSMFEALSIELIGQNAFGRNVIVQGNEQDPMLRAVRNKYDHTIMSPLNILALCFPEFRMVTGPLRILWQRMKEVFWLNKAQLNETLWSVAQKCVRDNLSAETNPNGEYSQFQLLRKAGIPEELMIAYSVNAFQGDYENVSTTLSFLTHLLMDHPEVQQKILDEVHERKPPTENPTPEAEYEYYTGLKYMESVIYEMLRLWPQTSFVRRSPSEDYEYVNSEGRRYVIPKGVHIQVAHHAVQRDQEVWGEDFMEFKPERFLTGGDRDKVSPNCVTYQGFGSGPRHCMGQRFAILILKMIVTTLLQKYEVQKCKRSGEVSDHAHALMNPTDHFYAKLVSRNNNE